MPNNECGISGIVGISGIDGNDAVTGAELLKLLFLWGFNAIKNRSFLWLTVQATAVKRVNETDEVVDF